MRYLDEKLKDPKSIMEQHNKSDRNDAIYYLVGMLPKQRQFAYYRTKDLAHDQFMVYWRDMEQLRHEGILYANRIDRTQKKRIRKSIEPIRETRLWDYKDGERDLNSGESTTIREAQEVVNLA